jgi:regulator of extracellular matrix RemA (YlzA/DUF370 family)
VDGPIDALADTVHSVVQPELAELRESLRRADRAAERSDASWDATLNRRTRTLRERTEAAEAALTRVREQCAEWIQPTNSRTWDAQVRDSIALSCAHMILAALTPPADQSDRNDRR